MQTDITTHVFHFSAEIQMFHRCSLKSLRALIYSSFFTSLQADHSSGHGIFKLEKQKNSFVYEILIYVKIK